jgi:polar amino acid transport system permease protein
VTDSDSTPIKAVPLRRPGRWISAAILVALLFLFAWGAGTNEAYDWPTYGKYLFDQRISAAALVTIELTVIAMVIAVVLGVLLAVMRLSDNPVLRALSWLYIWIFRGTPVYVQLVFWGLITSIYHQVHLGIPWGPSLFTFDVRDVGSAFIFAFIGLGLNEAAYMAEIVRAGIRSVDEGQTEAAQALGMSWPQTIRRIVLPQAMRVIIPPTGNEVISMLKTTSLVVAVPLTTELYSRARAIATPIFRVIPLLLVAATWYLIMTSVLMVGQYYLEKYFARGSSKTMSGRQLAALAKAQEQVGGGGS